MFVYTKHLINERLIGQLISFHANCMPFGIICLPQSLTAALGVHILNLISGKSSLVGGF